MSGIRTKSQLVRLFSSHQEYDIIVIIETWLNENFFSEEYFDSNIYNVFRKDRNANLTGYARGGGVLIAVKCKHHTSEVALENKDALLDQLCVHIRGIYQSIFVCASYIPPNSSYNLYTAHVDNILSLALNKLGDDNLCVLGDFNLCNVNWSSTLSKSALIACDVNSPSEIYLVDSFLSIDIMQVNCFPNKFGRTLDLIFLSKNVNFSILECALPIIKSDMHHVPLVIDLEFYEYTKISKLNSNFSFNFRLCDFLKLNNLLLNINWDCLFHHLNVSKCFEIFRTTVVEVCKSVIPPVTKKQYKIPWHNATLIKLRNKKNKFFRKFRKNNNSVFFALYKEYDKKFVCLDKFLHRNYVLSFEKSLKSNPKAFWTFVNSKKSVSNIPSAVFFGDKAANTPADAANLFAEFFKSNFKSNFATASDSDENVSFDIQPSIDFGKLVLSTEDVFSGISRLKPSSHTDIDGLSAVLFKQCDSLVYPLLLIFNKSLTSGTFIDAWKLAFISPIFKSGNKNDISNYRPISKLSATAKLFECIIQEKLLFAVKNIVRPEQHGFFPGRSTVSNLAVFSDDCIAAFQLGYQVDTVYTDFSKAFDRVSHVILIKKLACIGFHSAFLSWITSYLLNRLYLVVVDNVRSLPFVACSGVPQGSILGPILFVLFINDICSCFSSARFLLYADDVKIYSVITSSLDSELMQIDLDNFSNWCINNRLSLNINKCFQITFSKRVSLIDTSYHISSTPLSRVSEIKDLGIIFDSKFTFASHINFIITKSYAMLAFVRRQSSDFSDPYTLKLLYTAFVRSKLEYASFIWSPYYTCHAARIERIQKVFLHFALRNLRFSDPIPTYEARCLLINLKSLQNRRIILSLSFIFDLIHGVIDCPVLLERIFFNIPVRALRSSEFFYVGLSKSLYARNAPITRALIEFNKISKFVEIDFSYSKDHLLKFLNICYK